MSAYRRSADRWAAVAARDRAADGRFVFAVATTSIYCRPSCRSRAPRRENVRFFDDARAAAGAGFRACKRCRPDAEDPRAAQSAAIVKACRLLEHSDDKPDMVSVARAIGLSAAYFQRLFKKLLGVAPGEYRRRHLAESAREELGSAGSVTEAVYAAGYSSSSRFYDGVGRELGMAPRDARNRGAGHDVRYALRASSLGPVLVAWTERGVCDVRFGDTKEELVEALAARFTAARLARGDIPTWVAEVVDAVEVRREADVPLDISGTAFQARVWQELRKIPSGETRSYAAVARAIGRPRSVRAVAGACAANSLAVVVPCHRVISSDGALSDYRWGARRKAALLARETEKLAKTRTTDRRPRSRP